MILWFMVNGGYFNVNKPTNSHHITGAPHPVAISRRGATGAIEPMSREVSPESTRWGLTVVAENG